MRISSTFSVLAAAAVVAVSAGVYPAKTGSKGTGHTKGESDGSRKQQDDRFHLRSPDGRYVFGHTTGNQGRAEIRDAEGTVTGYYSYVGIDGRVVFVNYVADKDGYRVLSNTGAPSASVTIEDVAEDKNASPNSEKDFQQAFSDFTKRIIDKIVQPAGQKPVDPSSEGQQQVTVDPLYPNEKTNPSKHEEKNQFPDWNRVNISTTQNPTSSKDGIKYDEGQQQQATTAPSLDSEIIATQKSNIEEHETTETASKHTPLVPEQSQVPANGENSGMVFPEDHVKEITTEIINSRTDVESTVIDDTEKNSPVTKSVSIINDVQTTVSYYDVPGQSTEGSISRENNIQTTMSGVKQFEESSTMVISESATEHYPTIKETDEKFKFPTEAEILTTIKPLDAESFENVPTTEDPKIHNDFQTTIVIPNVDNTKIEKVDENEVVVGTSTAVYEPKITTTFQPESRVGDTETTNSIQYVTERNEDRFEFRTLEPTDRIGTTISPNYGQSEVQEQEIAWPEIPQEPVPQVLVPLDPYAENSNTKNSGIKTHPRPARDYETDEVKSTESASDVTETTTLAYHNDESATLFDFPKYYLIG